MSAERSVPEDGPTRSPNPASLSNRVISLEAIFAAASMVFGLLTVVMPAWIEALTGWDPDHHSGGFEWLIAAAFLICALGAALDARRRFVAAKAVTA
jgi:hypothetical protein